MNTSELALVGFTLLTQMSAGAFLTLIVVRMFAVRHAGKEEADRLSDRALVAVVVTLGLGMLISFLHLGSPLNAAKVFTNFRTSWLSREILFGVVFAALGVVYVALQWFKVGSDALRTALSWVTGLAGLVLVYTESRVYMMPIQPSWSTPVTVISFFVTTLLLGVLAIGAALVANYVYLKRKNPDCEEAQCDLVRTVLQWVAVASVVLVGLEFVVLPIYMGDLATSSSAAVTSLGMMVGEYRLALILRLALAFVGAGVLAVFLYKSAGSEGKEKAMGYLAYSAFILVFVSEFLGRLIFYGTHFAIGV